MTKSVLGPTLISTLTTDKLDLCAAAWCEHLQQRRHSEHKISQEQALDWQMPSLQGARVLWLENQLGEPWLRIIEVADAVAVAPFRHGGWLALEICVVNVDALYPALTESPFTVIGQPADLEISPNIRAMQLLGPSGEVLYLTEIKEQVPGFELPKARCAIDKLFIPVLLTTDRDAALRTYEQFPATHGVKFETKITVVNRARGLPLEKRHPVATVQLKGNNLIEIDQLAGLQARAGGKATLPPGISMISFAIDSLDALPAGQRTYRIDDGPFANRNASLLHGNGSELLEIIEI